MKKLLSLILVVCLVMGIVQIALAENPVGEPSINWFKGITPKELPFTGEDRCEYVSADLTEDGKRAEDSGYLFYVNLEPMKEGLVEGVTFPGDYKATINVYDGEELNITTDNTVLVYDLGTFRTHAEVKPILLFHIT